MALRWYVDDARTPVVWTSAVVAGVAQHNVWEVTDPDDGDATPFLGLWVSPGSPVSAARIAAAIAATTNQPVPTGVLKKVTLHPVFVRKDQDLQVRGQWDFEELPTFRGQPFDVALGGVEPNGTGPQGEQGSPGLSAYDLAVLTGFTGTLADWQDAIIGPRGGDPVFRQTATHLQVKLHYLGDETFTDLVDLETIRGPRGFLLQVRYVSGVGIEVKYADQPESAWTPLISLADLRGPRGFGLQLRRADAPGAGPEGTDTGVLQWRPDVVGADEATATEPAPWVDLVDYETIRGPRGYDVQLRQNATHVQWKYADEPAAGWRDLVDLETIRGPRGHALQLRYAVERGIETKYANEPESSWALLAATESFRGRPGFEVELRRNDTTGGLEWRRDVADAVDGRPAEAWQALVDYETIRGPRGFQVQMRLTATALEWRYADETTWRVLAPIAAITGPQGDSGYTIAVQHGFVGTEVEWLTSLEGETAFEVAQRRGFTGTVDQWLTSLNGDRPTFRQSATHLQWKLSQAPESAWANLVPLEEIRGPRGFAPQFRFVPGSGIQWKYSDESTWALLADAEALRGPQGVRGTRLWVGQGPPPSPFVIKGVLVTPISGDQYLDRKSGDLYDFDLEATP